MIFLTTKRGKTKYMRRCLAMGSMAIAFIEVMASQTHAERGESSSPSIICQKSYFKIKMDYWSNDLLSFLLKLKQQVQFNVLPEIFSFFFFLPLLLLLFLHLLLSSLLKKKDDFPGTLGFLIPSLKFLFLPCDCLSTMWLSCMLLNCKGVAFICLFVVCFSSTCPSSWQLPYLYLFWFGISLLN